MHVTLVELWLPIVLSGIAIFFASFLAWVVLPHHKPDYKGLPDEDACRASITGFGLEPGYYFFPFCHGADMKDPAVKKRMETPPIGILHIWPGPCNMGMNMGIGFVFYLVVGVLVAYMGTMGPAAGAGFMEVFRFAGTVAVMAYALALIPNGIWFGKPLVMIAKDVIDGIVYGLIVGAIFAVLWPAAQVAQVIPAIG